MCGTSFPSSDRHGSNWLLQAIRACLQAKENMEANTAKISVNAPKRLLANSFWPGALPCNSVPALFLLQTLQHQN